VDAEPGIKNESNSYDPNLLTGGANGIPIEYDELHVVCPPHTTEKRLMTKIDLRVIPFLCILFLNYGVDIYIFILLKVSISR